ncbi:hypothetical protein SLS58_011089 [Diplodia intermedia]|uniref:BTB domain-containing protein n=1 Tax=Diplodia intermedia TaxID=856260 RepID=A0ABR3T1K2_9PEZI
MSLKRKREFYEGDFSDLALILRDESRLFCHRVIVCSQCDYFKNALRPGTFKESHTQTIELKDYPPQAIRCMIDFIYTGKYSVFDQPDKICRPEEPGHHKPKQSCSTKSSSSSSYPSHNTTPPAASASEYARQMLAHADVYVVAEFYQVPELAKMAASVIDAELKTRFADMLGVFPKLAQTICAGVPASANDDPSSSASASSSTPTTLRGRVMKFGHEHMHAFTAADRLWDVLEEAPDFMEEAIEGMRLKLTVAANRIAELEDRVAALEATLGRVRAYKCPCGERFEMAMPTTAGVTVGCPRCKRTRLATSWDRKTYRPDA